MSIVILGCISSGGMLHYTENLYNGVIEHADARMVLIGTRAEMNGDAGRAASLFIEYSPNRYFQKILEKYNPAFYSKISNNIKATLNPDIVHITSYSTGLLSLVKALKKQGVHVIYTVHDPEPHDEGTTLWGKLYSVYQYRYQLPRVMKYCDAIHVHSALHLESIRTRYGDSTAKKTYVVQHGGGLTESIRKANKCPDELEGTKLEDKIVVLFFGRIEPYKGLNILLDALRLLSARNDTVYTIIAGSGSYMKELNTNGIKNIKIINRFINDDEIGCIFKSSDIVVLPYLEATQTGVIPMAYAYAKPVIATKVGGLPELVVDQKTGFLISANNTDELYHALLNVTANKEMLDKMGVDAENHLNDVLSWSVVSSLHVDVYRRLSPNQGAGLE